MLAAVLKKGGHEVVETANGNDEVVVAMMEADKGSWSQIEAYIEKHSDAQFSHRICPECAKKLYPEFGD